MECKNCGAELSDGVKFCSECGAKVDNEHEKETIDEVLKTNDKIIKDTNENKKNEEQKNMKSKKINFDKKTITIIILAIVIIIFSIISVFGGSLGVSKINYDGTYSDLNPYNPVQVTVKNGKIGVTCYGNSFTGEYSYDDSTDSIIAERKSDEDGVKFTLRKVDNNYYLGIDQVEDYYDFGYSDEISVYKDGTEEREKAQKQIDEYIEDATKEAEESEKKAKKTSESFKGTELSGNQVVTVGDILEPGVYNFAPVSGENYFDIDIFDNIDYYNQRENNEGNDYINHHTSYFEDEIVKGVVLRDGMVIDIGYDGVQYKKQ